MILSVIILVLLVGITYYHYIQGGFSSAISAFSAFCAVLLAFGYYEIVLNLFSAGKMADYSAGMMLVALFGLSYIILRVLLDALIPGNIRLPLWVDRGCAAGFGLIAAIFATGTFAVGAQLLPFGPSIGGHQRFSLTDRPVVLPKAVLDENARRDIDGRVVDQLDKNTLLSSDATDLWIATDQMALSLVSMASEFAFSGNEKFSSVHPDLLTSAFANRLGADLAGNRVAINTSDETQVTLANESPLFFINPNTVNAADAEIKMLRPNSNPLKFDKSSAGRLLVVRLRFDDRAADPDGYTRLTPAAAPLVIGGEMIYPLGAMRQDGKLALFRLDDQMLISMQGEERFVDLVYPLNAAAVEKASTGLFKPNTAFVQIKLLARVDLSGKKIDEAYAPTKQSNVLVKKGSPLISPDAQPNAAGGT